MRGGHVSKDTFPNMPFGFLIRLSFDSGFGKMKESTFELML